MWAPFTGLSEPGAHGLHAAAPPRLYQPTGQGNAVELAAEGEGEGDGDAVAVVDGEAVPVTDVDAEGVAPALKDGVGVREAEGGTKEGEGEGVRDELGDGNGTA